MDDLEMTIDGVVTTMHATNAGKLVVGFPVELPESKVTFELEGGPARTEELAIKLASGALTALRSAGFIVTAANNPQHPDNRRPDPIQGYATN